MSRKLFTSFVFVSIQCLYRVEHTCCGACRPAAVSSNYWLWLGQVWRGCGSAVATQVWNHRRITKWKSRSGT